MKTAWRLLMLCAVALSAHAAVTDARTLTIRVFSTAAVPSLTIDAKNATMRACDSCKDAAVPAHLSISAASSGAGLLIGGSQRSPRLRLAGELRMNTTDGRSVAAAGKWTVRAEADGLHVLLQVPSERYVMAVLQAEAGAEDGPEALKALAVVARSFAMTHPDRHGSEGLCDSTHCQAARFGLVPDRVRDAVNATAGETLWSGSSQVDGYFTQNCGGESADASAVWGGPRKPWLRVHADPYCQREPALWHASVGVGELAKALIAEGFRAPSTMKEVRVVAKDSSGRVAKLTLEGAGPTITVSASALRFAVNRELGWNRLRSDWYTVHGNGRDVVFDGRGYGHGVGLCQAGAAEMAREGKSYREILAFYFAGTRVRVNASDDGWNTQQANGWTLRTTNADASVLRDGDYAWAEAKKRWAPRTDVRPVVTIAPDTELFRQLTNKPGWALAATSGQRITLQPLSVLHAHSDTQALLLHEFLHALIESETNPSTPLWLREGLVEVLAEESAAAPAMTVQQVERALQSAANLRGSQRAHIAAAALTQRMIAKHGLGNVRGWLRGGVPAGVLAGQ